MNIKRNIFKNWQNSANVLQGTIYSGTDIGNSGASCVEVRDYVLNRFAFQAIPVFYLHPDRLPHVRNICFYLSTFLPLRRIESTERERQRGNSNVQIVHNRGWLTGVVAATGA